MPKKLSLDEIKIELKNINSNIEILSNEYNGINGLLECRCLIDNYTWDTNWKKLKSKIGCPKCSGNLKLNINIIKNRLIIINPNIKIISDDYKNNKTELMCMCLIDQHTWNTNWSNLSQGKGCPKCAGKISLTLVQARQKLINAGYIPLFNKYSKTTDILLAETKDGYKFQTTIDILNRNPSINVFYGTNPYFIENIKHYIKLNNINCKLITNKWMGYDSKLKFECSCGNKFITNWYEFSKNNSPKQQCNICGIKRRSGENHYEYNPNMTINERVGLRLKTSNNENYRLWRIQVFERDNYTCQCCGKKNAELRAHHLNGYHWYIEGRCDVNNGITLCKECHDNKYVNSFHYIYGTKNNTREQFEEFLLICNNKAS